MAKIFIFISFLIALASLPYIHSQPPNDGSVMQDLKRSLTPPDSLGWVDPDPCKWNGVQCSNDNRVTRIQIGNKGLNGGTLPPSISNLKSLEIFEVMNSQINGPLPTFAGLSSLKRIFLHKNNFTSIPSDFFTGLTSLESVFLDYNPFQPWAIFDSLKDCRGLREFSATKTSITGTFPDFFNAQTFPGLELLHLSFNNLEGELPGNLGGSSLKSLWLNGQKLSGTISALLNSPGLQQVWLQGNLFTGPLPDFSSFVRLEDFSVRDNRVTGPVPDSLLKLGTLRVVNLTNNLFQGPTPKFEASVQVDMIQDTNSFCLSNPGDACDPRVNVLLDVVKYLGYPEVFARSWKGNDPCSKADKAWWESIYCNNNGEVNMVIFTNMSLSGTISPNFSQLTAVGALFLGNNTLDGVIPSELTTLANLKTLDVSDNRLTGKVPAFRSDVNVITNGNLFDAPPPFRRYLMY